MNDECKMMNEEEAEGSREEDQWGNRELEKGERQATLGSLGLPTCVSPLWFFAPFDLRLVAYNLFVHRSSFSVQHLDLRLCTRPRRHFCVPASKVGLIWLDRDF